MMLCESESESEDEDERVGERREHGIQIYLSKKGVTIPDKFGIEICGHFGILVRLGEGAWVSDLTMHRCTGIGW